MMNPDELMESLNMSNQVSQKERQDFCRDTTNCVARSLPSMPRSGKIRLPIFFR